MIAAKSLHSLQHKAVYTWLGRTLEEKGNRYDIFMDCTCPSVLRFREHSVYVASASFRASVSWGGRTQLLMTPSVKQQAPPRTLRSVRHFAGCILVTRDETNIGFFVCLFDPTEIILPACGLRGRKGMLRLLSAVI